MLSGLVVFKVNSSRSAAVAQSVYQVGKARLYKSEGRVSKVTHTVRVLITRFL